MSRNNVHVFKVEKKVEYRNLRLQVGHVATSDGMLVFLPCWKLPVCFLPTSMVGRHVSRWEVVHKIMRTIPFITKAF